MPEPRYRARGRTDGRGRVRAGMSSLTSAPATAYSPRRVATLPLAVIGLGGCLMDRAGRYIAAVVSVAALLLTAGCGNSDSGSGGNSDGKVVLKVWDQFTDGGS